MVAIGRERDDLLALVSGYQAMGMIQFALGNLSEARTELERCVSYRGQDVRGVNCFPSMAMCYLSYVLYIMGDSEAARSMCDAALASARDESPRSIASALSNCCYTLQFLNEPEAMLTNSRELIELAQQKGMAMYENRGLVFKNLAQAQITGDSGAVDFVEQAVDELLRAGEEIETTFLLAVVAELRLALGETDAARRSLERAYAIAEANRELFYMSELMRLSAIVAHRDDPGDGGKAREWLDKALDLATSQQAEGLAAQSAGHPCRAGILIHRPGEPILRLPPHRSVPSDPVTGTDCPCRRGRGRASASQ